ASPRHSPFQHEDRRSGVVLVDHLGALAMQALVGLGAGRKISVERTVIPPLTADCVDPRALSCNGAASEAGTAAARTVASTARTIALFLIFPRSNGSCDD